MGGGDLFRKRERRRLLMSDRENEFPITSVLCVSPVSRCVPGLQVCPRFPGVSPVSVCVPGFQVCPRFPCVSPVSVCPRFPGVSPVSSVYRWFAVTCLYRAKHSLLSRDNNHKDKITSGDGAEVPQDTELLEQKVQQTVTGWYVKSVRYDDYQRSDSTGLKPRSRPAYE
ncbi:hypothetical protein BaRGS_00040544 [Batillaria attramentaria]|uniref:Uncharacterized protein n=1 Tax=Batillaria attramentaria TaxID=370345 RepID=A0ABD0IZQ3_9CAEN